MIGMENVEVEFVNRSIWDCSVMATPLREFSGTVIRVN